MSDRTTSGLPLFAAANRKRSKTSIEAGRSISSSTLGKRREHVYLAIASSDGLARFQIAAQLGVSDHWISSSVAALITAGRIRELPDRAVTNPASGKRCAVLVVAQISPEQSAELSQ